MRSLAELVRPLNLRSGRPGLILLTDERRLADPLAAAARLPAGSLVILRHYGDPQRAAWGARLARLCRTRRLVLLVAGDFALAQSLGAGLHLPEDMARTPGPRLRLWRRRTHRPLTAAAHSRSALRRAAEAGAGAALLSPVFPNRSHPGAPVLGPLAFRRLVRQAPLAVYGLGGITAATIGRLAGSDAAGVAAIDGLS
jgi:thiamine-phosphate pyrophosphorylase